MSGAEIILEVKKLAKQFTEENYVNPLPQEYLIIENAMFAAVNLVGDRLLEKAKGERELVGK